MNSIFPQSGEFKQVLSTDELRTRFCREPDYERESQALGRLARVLASDPGRILDELVAVALELCGAGSSGISILDGEMGGDPMLFRWRALAGAWSGRYLGSVLPRDYSPCGVVISRNSVQLMTDPARYYDYVGAIEPACCEVLLVPFSQGGEPVGTIWVVMHGENEHFDAEDARILSSLAVFASAGYQSLKATEALQTYGQARANEVHTLSKENRAKDEFIATIAHELRNPLAPIRNSCALLLRGGADPASVRRAAEIIDRQSSAMARLIDDLLDVSRVRLGVLELNPTKANLADILRSALEAIRLSDPTKPLEVDLQLPDEPLYVNGDPMRLTQVFGNLLSNAAKYTDADGRITVRAVRRSGNAVIDITDTGIGIASDQIESIFALFAQAGQAGSPRSRGGLGIGLHLARQLVAAHHGTLQATSAGVGCGSTFTLEIPCV